MKGARRKPGLPRPKTGTVSDGKRRVKVWLCLQCGAKSLVERAFCSVECLEAWEVREALGD